MGLFGSLWGGIKEGFGGAASEAATTGADNVSGSFGNWIGNTAGEIGQDVLQAGGQRLIHELVGGGPIQYESGAGPPSQPGQVPGIIVMGGQKPDEPESPVILQDDSQKWMFLAAAGLAGVLVLSMSMSRRR